LISDKKRKTYNADKPKTKNTKKKLVPTRMTLNKTRKKKMSTGTY
jgi:hypothetical protein